MKKIRQMRRRKVLVAGAVVVTVLGVAGAAMAYITGTHDSHTDVTVASREFPYAQPYEYTQPRLVPDTETQHIIRIFNPFDFAIAITHIPAGSSAETEGCPAGSVKTWSYDASLGVLQVDDPNTLDDDETGLTAIPAFGSSLYQVTAVFDTAGFEFLIGDVEHPENNQDACLSASLRVDLVDEMRYIEAT